MPLTITACLVGIVSCKPSQLLTLFAQFGIFIATTAQLFIFLPVHCDILSPARHKPSGHQPVVPLLTCSLLLETVKHLALPWRHIFSTLFCICYQSLVFILGCFTFSHLPRGKDFCKDWDLKCFKSSCCMNKFAIFYSFYLNINCKQYFAKFSFSF